MENDFDASIFIITPGNQYIPTDEYDMMNDGDGVFIMLTNEELDNEFEDNNSIYIYKDWINATNHVKSDFGQQIVFTASDFVTCQWQMDRRDIPHTFKLNSVTDDIGLINTSERLNCVRKYLNGQKNTLEIIRNVKPNLGDVYIEKYIPAVMVAYHTEIMFNGHMVHGYLPSIG